jgi:hypothetical protein
MENKKIKNKLDNKEDDNMVISFQHSLERLPIDEKCINIDLSIYYGCILEYEVETKLIMCCIK